MARYGRPYLLSPHLYVTIMTLPSSLKWKFHNAEQFLNPIEKSVKEVKQDP